MKAFAVEPAASPVIAPGCQAENCCCAGSPAAAQNAPQSRPGALLAKSARRHGLSALCASCPSSIEACAAAIFISSATTRSARVAGSLRPASVITFST